MGARRRSTFSLFLWSGLLVTLLAGCRSNDLVEAELRSREREVRELREELSRLEFHNEALQRELGTAHHQGVLKISPEQAAQTFTLRKITLGRGTGGYDDDRLAGDEALQVVLEPRDEDDHVIKAPGSVRIVALDVSPEGVKRPFSAWEVPPEQLRRSWKSGLFSTGYVLVLGWHTWPTNEQVRVVVRFETPDGRTFEADRDVRVRLRPSVPHEKMPPPDAPVLPPPEPVLPMPRKTEPIPKNLPEPAPVPRTGVEPAGCWQAPSLLGAVQLRRPVPVRPVE